MRHLLAFGQTGLQQVGLGADRPVADRHDQVQDQRAQPEGRGHHQPTGASGLHQVGLQLIRALVEFADGDDLAGPDLADGAVGFQQRKAHRGFGLVLGAVQFLERTRDLPRPGAFQIVGGGERASDDVRVGRMGDQPALFPDLVRDDPLLHRLLVEQLGHGPRCRVRQAVAVGQFLAERRQDAFHVEGCGIGRVLNDRIFDPARDPAADHDGASPHDDDAGRKIGARQGPGS
ncbi:hypothetical protein [Ruegeria intermedia]|uniref:hypothetical protein n=1 Tax=Ruegeria intermedia TaxID=996115 RepID=UPI00122C6140